MTLIERHERYAIRGLSLRDRLDFYSIPEPNSGCRLWLGAVDAAGYGQTWLDGRNEKAHRAAWIADNGPIPAGLLVCHKCDNTFCIHTPHLFLGTNRDNALDRSAKRRFAKYPLPGMSNPAAKLTDEQVVAIFKSPERVVDLARLFDVSDSTVSGIKNRQLWRHLTMEYEEPWS